MKCSSVPFRSASVIPWSTASPSNWWKTGKCVAPLRDRPLERVAEGVQNHARVAVAHAPQRLRELALATRVAHPGLVELAEGLGARDRAQRLGFDSLGIHPPTVPSPSVSSYDAFAPIYDDWASHMTEDVAFYVDLAREADGPVVELAVGNGRVAIPVAQAIGRRVVGVDRSPAMLA